MKIRNYTNQSSLGDNYKRELRISMRADCRVCSEVDEALRKRVGKFTTANTELMDRRGFHVLKVVEETKEGIVLQYYLGEFEKPGNVVLKNARIKLGDRVCDELLESRILVCVEQECSFENEKERFRRNISVGALSYIHVPLSKLQEFLLFYSSYRCQKENRANKLDRRIRSFGVERDIILMKEKVGNRQVYRFCGFIKKNKYETEYIQSIDYIYKEFMQHIRDSALVQTKLYDIRYTEYSDQINITFSFPNLGKKIAKYYDFKGNNVIVPGVRIKINVPNPLEISVQQIMYIHHDCDSYIITKKSRVYEMVADIDKNEEMEEKIIETLILYFDDLPEVTQKMSDILNFRSKCYLSDQEFICTKTEERVAAKDWKKCFTQTLTKLSIFDAELKKQIKFTICGHPRYDEKELTEDILNFRDHLNLNIKSYTRYNEADVIYALMNIPKIFDLSTDYKRAEEVAEVVGNYILAAS